MLSDSALGIRIHAGTSSIAQARRSTITLALQSIQRTILRHDLALVILLGAPILGSETTHSGKMLGIWNKGRIIQALLGQTEHFKELGAFIDADDVALCQVRALRQDVPGSTPWHPRAHILAADIPDGFEWESAKTLVANVLPESLKGELYQYTGSSTTTPWVFDTSKAKQFFDWKFKTLEESLVDVVTQHLWWRCWKETHMKTGPSAPIVVPLQQWLFNRWVHQCHYLDLLPRYR